MVFCSVWIISDDSCLPICMPFSTDFAVRSARLLPEFELREGRDDFSPSEASPSSRISVALRFEILENRFIESILPFALLTWRNPHLDPTSSIKLIPKGNQTDPVNQERY
jgi:hypothetical protein